VPSGFGLVDPDGAAEPLELGAAALEGVATGTPLGAGVADGPQAATAKAMAEATASSRFARPRRFGDRMGFSSLDLVGC
jgi:hypothetical protein